MGGSRSHNGRPSSETRGLGGEEGQYGLNLWSVKVSPCNLGTRSLPISILSAYPPELWNDLRPSLQMMPAVRFHRLLISVVTVSVDIISENPPKTGAGD